MEKAPVHENSFWLQISHLTLSCDVDIARYLLISNIETIYCKVFETHLAFNTVFF